MVPVVKHAEARDLWDSAAELARLATAARDNKITIEELTGSTITITSLGSLGGIVSTPIINYPEVAIIGVNKIATRPVYVDGAVLPRQIMNLSSSFDHRVVDGADAAAFIQQIKTLLETPALLFICVASCAWHAGEPMSVAAPTLTGTHVQLEQLSAGVRRRARPRQATKTARPTHGPPCRRRSRA